MKIHARRTKIAQATATALMLGVFSANASDVIITGPTKTFSAGLFGISDDVYVGGHADGALSVMDGSIAFRNNLYVGRYADGAGTVDVEGDGSLFSLGASIPHPQPGDISAIGHTIIGGQGAGEVNIKNGGVFLLDTDGSLTLGESEGGRGVVNIDGESSILRTVPSDFFSSQPIFGTMKVGDSGSGIINITNGGLGAINSPLELGSQKSGYGEINVSGASDSGIASNITGPLGTHTSSIIGVAGRGVVNVDNGGTGDFGILHLGLFAGSTGTLTATGANSLLHVVHELYVGVEGEGQTSIEDGASATFDGSVHVGQQAGSTGTLTVTGANSLLSSPNGYGLYVGDAGTGELSVNDGASAAVHGSVTLGHLAGSTGTLTVTGANSLLHGFHELYVGFEGEGQTSIEDGASATFDGSVHVGQQAGSTGTLTVTGANSLLSSPNHYGLYVGDAGTGELSVNDGASAAVHGSVTLGHLAGSTGTLTVTGANSLLHGFHQLYVGVEGEGQTSIEDGASATFDGSVYVGQQAGSTGTLTVTGANSLLHGFHELYVGVEGEGQTSIEDGASATFDGSVYVGQQAGSTGTLTVTGANSLLSSPNGYGLYVGDAGAGTLNVDNGGTATTKGDAYVGNTGTGRVSISGGGIFNVVNGTVRLGALAGSTGTLTVAGTSSLFDMYLGGKPLYVGDAGTGELSVNDGASAAFHGSVTLGHLAGSTGTLTVTGANSLLSSPNGYGLYVGDAGAGTLNVDNGGTVTTPGELHVGNTGTGVVSISGGGNVTTQKTLTLASSVGSVGSLVIGAAAGSDAAAPGTVATSDGAIHVGLGTANLVFNHTATNYAFDKNLEVQGGGSLNLDIYSGRTKLTTAAFDGNTTLTGGVLELGNSTSLGHGDIAFNGGTLDVGTDLTLHSAASLTLTSGGIRVDGSSLPAPTADPENATFFTNSDTFVQGLISADTITGTAAALTLDGVNSSDQTEIHGSDGDTVGTASWGFKLAQQGLTLGIASGLTNVDIYQDKALSVNLADSGSTVATVDAILSGAGGVALSAEGGTLTFGNVANAYTGSTSLTAGTVDAATDNAFGASSSLALGEGATLNLRGHTQAVGALDTADGSLLDLGGGSLSVKGGAIAGRLAGDGALVFVDGNTAITGANADLQAAVSIAPSATAILSQGNGLGQGDIALQGGLVLGGSEATTLSNVLTGSGAVTNTGNWTLAQANTFTGGTTVSSGRLTLLTSDAAGAGGIVNNTVLNLAGTEDSTLANEISGAGQLAKTGDNAWRIEHNNVNFTGSTDITSGRLVLKTAGALGSSAINNDSELRLSGVTGTLDNSVTGTGLLMAADGTQANLSGLSAFAGTLNVAGDSMLTAADTELSQLSLGIVDGTLAVNAAQGEPLGLGNAWMGGGAFLLTAGSADAGYRLSGFDAFTGKVSLVNGHYTLDGRSSGMFGAATLVSGDGNVLTLDTNATGALGLDGGTLDLADQAPVTAQSLAMTSGTIEADLSSVEQGQINETNLFTSGDNIERTLVHTVSGLQGSVADLTLQDRNGLSLDPLRAELKDVSGTGVGLGSWGLKLAQEANDLNLAWGLQGVDLYQDKVLALNVADGGSTEGTFNAVVSGTGGLSLTAAGGRVILGNVANTYTGPTSLQAGTVEIATDNAFGATSGLAMASGTTLNLQGHAQTVGVLDTVAGSALNLDGGSLTLKGGAIAGVLAGDGALAFADGSTAITGGNAALGAAVSIASTATVTLSQGNGLGRGAIAINGQLAFQDANGVLVNALSGGGRLSIDPSDITLSGDNRQFSGTMEIADAGSVLRVTGPSNLGAAAITNAGTFVVDTSEDWSLNNLVTGSGSFIKDGNGVLTTGATLESTGAITVDGGTLVMSQGSGNASLVQVNTQGALASFATIDAPVINAGTLNALNSLGTYTDHLNQDLLLSESFTNAGLVDLAAVDSNAAPGNSLTVRNGYVGNNGVFRIRAVLGGDDSQADRLVIDGGSATGHTSVIVDNAGGAGAKTSTGIVVVKTVNEATTTADAFSLDSRSTGYRERFGTIAAGAYDYTLKRGGAGGVADDWYLISSSTFRPEVGVYLANRNAATSMFGVPLQARIGNASKRAASEEFDTPFWVRVSGGSVSYDEVRGQKIGLDYSNLVTGLDADVDIGLNGATRVGAMVGYGNATTSSRLSSTGERAGGRVRGVMGGVYGTWFASTQENIGAYINSSLRYGRYRNRIQDNGLDAESYNASSASASLEGGYGFRLNDSVTRPLFLQPQAEVIYDHYKQAERTELSTGARVVSEKPDNVSYRLGLRLQGSFKSSDEVIQPFIALNWYNNTNAGAVSFDSLKVNSEAARHHLEVSGGTDARVGHNFVTWGSLGWQVGSNDYSGVMIQGGVKYSW
ncbi:autotransporter outer membrane beta-barrel domain-containing protein [Xanthomonas phaseoli]|uniref:autotransporter outer membrane beta-barrel domain-containing protein n=1 Tax=Xanthomonas phaseoli TaxID=1985254 RepID=UPI0009E69D7E|nr:autotransporter outer membrane beta-barrel domain-containing protein [Xanthomonas phaseoli]